MIILANYINKRKILKILIMITNLLNFLIFLHNLFTTFKLYLNLLRLYLLWFIGAIAVSWYIWARFIRERLPKDIPIELSELGLYILIYMYYTLYIFICFSIMIITVFVN
jgi:hypothetical protein